MRTDIELMQQEAVADISLSLASLIGPGTVEEVTERCIAVAQSGITAEQAIEGTKVIMRFYAGNL